MLEKISIIYNSCDKYESLWMGFFTLFDKYWKNCQNDIILNTETKNFSYKNLKIRRPNKIEENSSWSKRLMLAIESVSTPYVLLILDDFYLKDYINLKELERCVEKMEKDSKIKSFTFAWQPGPNIELKGEDFFEKRGRFSSYRVNAQIALWRVSYLKKILRTYENPWQFELSGSFRSSIYGGELYSLKKSSPLVFDYDWGFLVVRGKINKELKKYFEEKEGLKLNLPFEELNEEEYKQPKGIRFFRLIKYFFDMLVSLVRK